MCFSHTRILKRPCFTIIISVPDHKGIQYAYGQDLMVYAYTTVGVYSYGPDFHIVLVSAKLNLG